MKKILICEDEIDAREIMAKILANNEYEIAVAEDGKTALDRFKEFKPDLVLLDVRMPKIDGLEVAKEIRKSDAAVKIIFITAFVGDEIRREASQYNISDYIVKPIPKDILLQKISATFAE
jgi:CheY-like chemotaxis protein